MQTGRLAPADFLFHFAEQGGSGATIWPLYAFSTICKGRAYMPNDIHAWTPEQVQKNN